MQTTTVTHYQPPQGEFFWKHAHAADSNPEAGQFEGYLAIFGNRDSNGDIIDAGAFAATLAAAHAVKAAANSAVLLPLLWQHKSDEPCGFIKQAWEDHRGLFVRGQFDLATERGRQAYSGAKKGYLRGLSIGYDTVRSYVDSNRVRHLKEITLWEGSPVSFPANAEAHITEVKRAASTVQQPPLVQITLRSVPTEVIAPPPSLRVLKRRAEALQLEAEELRDPEPRFSDRAQHDAWAYRAHQRKIRSILLHAQEGDI